MASEVENIVERYRRREGATVADRYHVLAPAVYMSMQERERAFIGWIREAGIGALGERRVLDVGCGNGSDLLLFLRLGVRPENLFGIELLAPRASSARERLPAAARIEQGDASSIELLESSFDVVLQSTVFSSILDGPFRRTLAERMWRLVKPGGGVLSYDFVYDNPRNADVRGVTVREIRALFPGGTLSHQRLTLAPPIARLVTRAHPDLYSLFNLVPFLRTHALCYIRKPA
jgi:SAM-dependent methyltransferase